MKDHYGLTQVFKKPRIKGRHHVMLDAEESQSCLEDRKPDVYE